MASHTTWFARLRIVATALAVIAALTAVATFGVDLSISPFSPAALNGPTTADSNGEHTAIVDSASRRMFILNAESQITGIVDCDTLNSPIEAITDVCVADKTVYVAGVIYQADSDFIETERVVAYDLNGASEQVVYEHGLGYDKAPSIKTMDGKGDGVYVVQIFEAEAWEGRPNASLMFVDRTESHKVEDALIEANRYYDIGYSAKVSEYWGIDMHGILVSGDISTVEGAQLAADHVFTSVDVADNGNVYVYDDEATSAVCMLKSTGELTPILPGSGYSSLHANGQVLTACQSGSNAVVTSSLDGRDQARIERCEPSRALAGLLCAILACRIYLLLFVVVTLARKLYGRVKEGRFGGFGPMLASVVVVGVIGLAIGYTTYGTYKTQLQTRIDEINVLADYLSMTTGAIGANESVYSDQSVVRTQGATTASDEDADEEVQSVQNELRNLATWAGSIAYAANNNGVGIYVTVYGVDEERPFYLYDSSSEYVIGSGANAAASYERVQDVAKSGMSAVEVYEGSTLRDRSLYRLVAIPTPDGAGTMGVVEIGSRTRAFQTSVANDQSQRIIALLVIMLVVYLTYIELRECVRCFVSFQYLKHHHDSIAILTRPFSFFVTLLSSIDAVMTTLIARALMSANDMGESGLLLAMPSVMLGVGLAMGQAIYGAMGSRVVIQKLMVRGAVLVTVAALATAGVVFVGNYWLYCAAKLAMAIPFGLLYTLSYSLPRRADTEEVRVLAAGGIKRTDTSAAALGTVLGGYVAQNLGNGWVYLLVAVVGAIVLVMARNLLPSTKHPLEHEAKSVDSRGEAALRLLTSKTTLPIVFFVMLPAILASGYNSFMFPLFSANLGLQTSAINNLFVLGQLVVFVSIETIERLEGRYGKWLVALAAIGLLSVVFLLFSFNTTLVWATVTIALTGVLCKASDGWKALWPRSAKAIGLTTGIATGTMFAVRSVLLIVQPLLLGVLLSVNSAMAVIILGVMCAVCAAAFYLSTRHSVLAVDAKEIP